MEDRRKAKLKALMTAFEDIELQAKVGQSLLRDLIEDAKQPAESGDGGDPPVEPPP